MVNSENKVRKEMSLYLSIYLSICPLFMVMTVWTIIILLVYPYIYIYIYTYLPTPPLGQDMTQSQFLSEV